MDRRTFITSTATGLTGLGIGLLSTAQKTEAQASVDMGTLSIADESAVTTQGFVEDISCTVAGQWSYELPGGTPSKWIVALRVSDGEQWHTVGDTSGNVEYAMYEDSYTVTGSLVQSGPFQQSFFSAPGPGKQTTVELPFSVRFRVLQDDETVLATETIEDTAGVTIGQEAINATLYGELSGEGGLEITT
jgi:hypothetical protein